MEQEKIYKTGTFPIISLLVNLVGATAIFFVASPACRIARQDGWIVPIIAGFYGAYVIYIVYRLGMLFPGKTFFEYLPLIVGKTAGKILGVVYIIFLYYMVSTVLREAMALFYGTGAFRLTPPVTLAVLFMIVATYAVFSGFEVISRTMSIYWPIIAILYTITLCLAIPYVKLDSLLPIGEAGIITILKGSIVPFAYYGELFLLGMILPYAQNLRQGFIAGNIANLLLSFFITIMVIAMITVLGVETTERAIYALFFLNDFVPPIGTKIYLLCIWVTAFWGKIVLLQFIITEGTSRLFGLRSYHFVNLPVAALILALAFSFYRNVPDMLVSIPRTFPGVALVFEYLIPTFLLVIALLKVKMRVQAGSDQTGGTSIATSI